MIYIFWTCKDREEAKRVVRTLLEKRLIACATIFPEVESVFRWEGKVDEAKESKVILKTRKGLFEAVCQAILENCSYEVPEIVEVEAGRGNPRYLQWVADETGV